METKQQETEACLNVEPQEQHRWLQQLVGEWLYESEAIMEPGQPPMKHTGSETVRAIGDLWIQGEGQGEMPGGGKATMLITLGYNPQTKRFVGTWVGSMMSHLWVYDGELDAAKRVLSLTAQGPDMSQEGRMATYKDVVELRSDDHRVLTAYQLGEDGEWHRFMTAHYRRRD